MAADGGIEEYLRRRGLTGLDPDLALVALERLAGGGGDPAAVVARVDWARFAPAFAAARPAPLLTDLPEAGAALADAATGAGADALRRRLAGLGAEERTAVLVELVREQAAVVLGHARPDAIDPTRAFREAGFDSLTAVELRNRIGAATGQHLPATLVFDYPAPADIARHLDSLLGPDADPDRRGGVVADLDRLAKALAAETGTGTDTRTEITARLRGLLALWTGDSVPEDTTDDEGAGLDEATDDEMFDLIDKEFGIS
nr:beta-ketoacyl reductase [Streptomyces corynorhini]